MTFFVEGIQGRVSNIIEYSHQLYYVPVIRMVYHELNDLGIKDEVLQEYAQREDAYPLEEVEEYLYKDGDMSGYLFKCIHCNKYHLWVDAN